MQATIQKPTAYSGSAAVANLIGAAIALLIFAVLTNSPIPLLGSDRATFIALIILGTTMCALGGVGRAPSRYGWTHPVTLFGIVVGIVAMLLAAAVLVGQPAFLDPIATIVGRTSVDAGHDRPAIVVLGVLMAIKWLVGLVYVR